MVAGVALSEGRHRTCTTTLFGAADLPAPEPIPPRGMVDKARYCPCHVSKTAPIVALYLVAAFGGHDVAARSPSLLRASSAAFLSPMHQQSNRAKYTLDVGNEFSKVQQKKRPEGRTYLFAVPRSSREKGGGNDEAKDTIQTEHELLCIRFSRSFQRHVVYRPKRGRAVVEESSPFTDIKELHHNATSNTRISMQLFCRFDDECNEVVESFPFLDEAMEKYPRAKLVRLPEVAAADDDDYEHIVPGMGTTPSTRIARTLLGAAARSNENRDCSQEMSDSAWVDDGIIDVADLEIEKQGHAALQYLSSLTASLVTQDTKQSNTDSQAIQERIASMLGHRIGQCRLMCHTPQSILLNYNRIMDLFTRSRTKKKSAFDADAIEIVGGGLAFTEAGVRSLVSYFPELCLYDFHELQERIRFMMAPQPPGKLTTNLKTVHGLRSKKSRGRPLGSAPNNIEVDWPRLSWEGYGAGLTVEQATEAIRAVPNILAQHHTDARKPTRLYFFQELLVLPGSTREAEIELEAYLTGADPSDFCTFAYLNNIGVQWGQVRVLLDAFPTLTCCDTEPGWELINQGPMKDELNEPALIYMRKRLQIGTGEVFHMIKTHSRLSSYSVQNTIMPKLNALQVRIGFSSRELRKVILRMPSLLGMGINSEEAGSLSALDERLQFFFGEAGMTQSDLKSAILKQPSLLQYSVENSLRPKMQFLVDELSISQPIVSRIITTAPAFMGLSLSENIIPKVGLIMDRCSLSAEQVGVVVATVPSILTLSAKTKIELCLSFLTDALFIPDQKSLGSLIQSAPRILIQGVESSLSKKIDMIHEAVEIEMKRHPAERLSCFQLCMSNPALLVTTNSILSKRIQAWQDDPDRSLSEALGPSARGRKQMFGIVRGKVVSLNSMWSNTNTSPPSSGPAELVSTKDLQASAKIATAVAKSNATTSSLPSTHGKTHQITPDVSIIRAFTSGQVYPTDNSDTVRGVFRTGGMAIHIPQKLSSKQLEIAAESSWGQIIPVHEGGSNFKAGLIMAGFTPLKPSRNRCNLCACELALKVVLNFLKGVAASSDLSSLNVRVEICTDSFYAWKLLQDGDQISQWGAYPSLEEFVFNGAGPRELANPDILLPLAQTYLQLVENSEDVCLGKSVEVVFRHTSEVFPGAAFEGSTKRMNNCARQAAWWAFNRERKGVKFGTRVT